MIFFGHIGIPLAVLQNSKKINKPGLKKFLEALDYRVLLIGALIPDLVDKPLYFMLHEKIGTSQSYGHTLVFMAIMLLTGTVVYRKHEKPFLLALAMGILFHDGLDFIAMNFKNFLWPLFGFGFISSEHIETSLMEKLIRDISSPYYLAGELIGLPTAVYYFFKLFSRKSLIEFIKCGKIES